MTVTLIFPGALGQPSRTPESDYEIRTSGVVDEFISLSENLSVKKKCLLDKPKKLMEKLVACLSCDGSKNAAFLTVRDKDHFVEGQVLRVV